MATVNFSVPEKIKLDFQAAFDGENKSAIIANLMRQAVEERQRQERRSVAIDALLKLRLELSPVSTEKVREARREGRP